MRKKKEKMGERKACAPISYPIFLLKKRGNEGQSLGKRRKREGGREESAVMTPYSIDSNSQRGKRGRKELAAAIKKEEGELAHDHPFVEYIGKKKKKKGDYASSS